MPESSIINADLVLLDIDAGTDKESVIGRLAHRLAESGRATDTAGLIAAIMTREDQSATGLPGDIAIPHCRSAYVNTASIGFARLKLIMAFDVTLKAPHGGVFVFFAIGNLLWFLIALGSGTVVGATAVVFAKQFTKARPRHEQIGPVLVAA